MPKLEHNADFPGALKNHTPIAATATTISHLYFSKKPFALSRYRCTRVGLLYAWVSEGVVVGSEATADCEGTEVPSEPVAGAANGAANGFDILLG